MLWDNYFPEQWHSECLNYYILQGRDRKSGSFVYFQNWTLKQESGKSYIEQEQQNKFGALYFRVSLSAIWGADSKNSIVLTVTVLDVLRMAKCIMLSKNIEEGQIRLRGNI